MSIRGLLFGRKSPSLGGGQRQEEDPTIYGHEMSGLRDRLRENKGKLPCLNCGSKVRVDLRAIEDQIKKNRALANSPIGAGRALIFVREPGEKRFSVCKTCKDLLCDPCTERALAKGCPKCGDRIEFIDHITD
jgi:hypothetical protein